MRGADLVIQTLIEAGVTTIFAVSGNQVMPVFDACYETNIRLVHVRHEASAVYMADAWAQLTGEIGVALVPAATGFLNALGPIYPAKRAESPVLLLSGDSPLAFDGLGAFQEMDQVAASASLTKFSSRPLTADEMGSDIAKAIKVAQAGRPGPVHIALAHDLLNAATDSSRLPAPSDFVPAKRSFSRDAAAAVMELLAGSQRPLILTGPQLSPSREKSLHQNMAEAMNVPFITMENPRGLSDPCLGAIADVMPKADFVVFLGKEVDFTSSFAKQPAFDAGCRFVVIDPEQDAIEQAQRVLGDRLLLAYQADSKGALLELLRVGVEDAERADWFQEVANAVSYRNVPDSVPGVSPYQLCASVQRVLDAAKDPVLIVDGGEFGQWGQAYLNANSRLINGISGAIGGGLCFAIAAQLACPEATVVALMGDGTAGFHFSEFDTAVRNNANIIVVIGNDSRWNAELLIQTRDYGKERLIGCELNPEARYDLAASGFGCHGEFVEVVEQLDAALDRSIKSKRPACINVVLNGQPAPDFSSKNLSVK